jgi:hypothetical protein
MEVVPTETGKKNTISVRQEALAISILDPYIRFESNRKNRTGEQFQTAGNKGAAAFLVGWLRFFRKKLVFNNEVLLVS